MAKKGPKESQQLMLRWSQWKALRELAKAYGCALVDMHLARRKSVKS